MNLSTIYSDRLHALKEGLSIARAQAFKWERFEAAVKAALNISSKSSIHDVTGINKYPSLPITLGNELQRNLFRTEACRVLLESVEALYAILSVKQRRLADRLLAPLLSDVLARSSERRGSNAAA